MLFKVLLNRRIGVEDRFISQTMDVPLIRTLTSDSHSRPNAPSTFTQTVENTVGLEYIHLAPPSRNLKENIITEWQSTFSAESLKRLPCAVCSKLVKARLIETVAAKTLNLALLRNDDLPTEARPRDYNIELYQQAILNPKGMSDTANLGDLNICRVCHTDLKKQRMPKFALCNWLYYGRSSLPEAIREAFDESSTFERTLISRARSNVLSCRFAVPGTEVSNGEAKGHSFRHSKRGIKGNVVVTPLDVIRLNEVLPPSADTIRDTLCVLFTGPNGKEPDKETIQKMFPVLVRKSRVKQLIRFLLDHNPHYRPVEGFLGYSEEYLNNLFTDSKDCGIPASVEIAVVKDTEVTVAATSAYTQDVQTTLPHDQNNDEDSLLMENVGYTMSEKTPISYEIMKQSAIRRCVEGKPYLKVKKGGKFIPDFDNPYILSWILPHLDPWGIGGFHHPRRKRYISMEDQLCHLLQSEDNMFDKDPEFAFIFSNVIRKKKVTQSIRFSAPTYKYRGIVDSIMSIDRVHLEHLMEKFRVDPMYQPAHDTEKNIVKVLRTINTVTHNVPGSVGQKISMRNELRSIIVAKGAPTLFVTINPSDRDNPMVQLLCRPDPTSVDDIMRGISLNDWNRRILASRNPAACAIFFDTVIKGFIDIILRYGKDGGGIYGV
ncbi:hypothetical protein DFP72DRAFT_816993, partial [Ephemerocybe angulata]